MPIKFQLIATVTFASLPDVYRCREHDGYQRYPPTPNVNTLTFRRMGSVISGRRITLVQDCRRNQATSCRRIRRLFRKQ